ncbi:MAG: hypothetical protein OEZ54_09100 [Gemmatimonadota bacterium]|nr:hypothetical protein [Gemmatimonadota bacterium]
MQYRKPKTLSIPAMAFALIAISTPGHAQSTYDGFWLGLSGGGGLNTTAGVDAGKRAGSFLDFRIGTVSAGARFSFDGLFWKHHTENLGYSPARFLHSTTHFGPTLRAAPFAKLPGYLRTGLGLGKAKASTFHNVLGQRTVTEMGVSAIFGIGYETPFSEFFALTWEFTSIYQTFGLRAGGLEGEISALFLSVGITYR